MAFHGLVRVSVDRHFQTALVVDCSRSFAVVRSVSHKLTEHALVILMYVLARGSSHSIHGICGHSERKHRLALLGVDWLATACLRFA